MAPPWIKLRPFFVAGTKVKQEVLERVDGWWMHRIDATGWCIHNENGAAVAHLYHDASAPAQAIQVIANNSILYAQFRGMGHPQPIAWRPRNGKTDGTPTRVTA